MSTDKKAILKTFLAEYGVLIVDKNPSSRNRLLKIISDLGCKRNMIFTVGRMSEAQEALKQQKIGLVMSDYEVEGGSGFDLFKMVRTAFPHQSHLVQVLVTSNISQTAVAKAAEEDVDSFIIKPYTLQSIQENLISTISFKISPPVYIKKINEGKVLLEEKKYNEALAKFQEAHDMNSKPSLALFYMGYTQNLLLDNEEAKNKFNSGLVINGLHFKCLVGLYDLYLSQKNFTEAYSVVKKIAKYFPANPERLIEIIRLAVATKNYADMLMYYEFFTQLEQRSPELTNYMGAGLLVTGKFFIQEKNKDLALTHFEKIAISCTDQTKFLKGIITSLVDARMYDVGPKFLSRFRPDQLKTDDYLVCDYLTSFAGGTTNFASAITKGIELYNLKIRDYHVLTVLIEAMLGNGMKEKSQDYVMELNKLYPDRKMVIAA